MEIKIIARLIGAEEQTTTREAFWQELRRRSPIRRDESDIPEDNSLAERQIYEMFPKLLKGMIQGFIQEHPGVRISRGLWSFRRRSALGEDFLITVKSLQYGSLEILLNFLAGDNFPISSSDLVQLLNMYAPSILSSTLGGVPLAVTVGEATGSLRGDGPDADQGREQSALLRRVFYLANFSLVVPVALSLGICYVIFHAMVTRISAVDEERRALVHDLLGQVAKVDSDRSQLVKDALDLMKESRTNAAEMYRQIIELKRGQSEKPPASGPGRDRESNVPPPSEKPLLVTHNYRIYGIGPNIDFAELTKGIVDASLEAGPKHIREVIQGVGDGIDVAKKTVNLTSDLVDLYRKIWPENTKDAPPPSSPPVLPKGTLLDRQVNFEFNSAELDRKIIEELRSLTEKVRADHSVILIEGHADGAGAAAYNQRLSKKRADAVRKFLVDNGVPANQIHTYGYGQGYFWLPYSPSDAANRRVRVIEFTVADEDRCKWAPPE